MEDSQQHLNPQAVTHLLQHTLRSLCTNHGNSPWVYAVFWRILPRNYPPPRWDLQGETYGRTRGNRRNWILVWEDGFCDFAGSAAVAVEQGSWPAMKWLQPELFFKMSHEIYNYGEGLIGNVAADHSHKWVLPQDKQEINFLTSRNDPAESHPRTWVAQFQCGIKTIALIAVRGGVVQLGALHKVAEELSYVILIRKKFAYLESIPGVLLPHPASSAVPITAVPQEHCWTPYPTPASASTTVTPDVYDQCLNQLVRITPSMSSLDALLSTLPPVGPASSSLGYYEMLTAGHGQRQAVANEEIDTEEYVSSCSSIPYYVNGE